MIGKIFLSNKRLSTMPGVRTILNLRLGNKVHATIQGTKGEGRTYQIKALINIFATSTIINKLKYNMFTILKKKKFKSI